MASSLSISSAHSSTLLSAPTSSSSQVKTSKASKSSILQSVGKTLPSRLSHTKVVGSKLEDTIRTLGQDVSDGNDDDSDDDRDRKSSSDKDGDSDYDGVDDNDVGDDDDDSENDDDDDDDILSSDTGSLCSDDGSVDIKAVVRSVKKNGNAAKSKRCESTLIESIHVYVFILNSTRQAFIAIFNIYT